MDHMYLWEKRWIKSQILLGLHSMILVILVGAVGGGNGPWIKPPTHPVVNVLGDLVVECKFCVIVASPFKWLNSAVLFMWVAANLLHQEQAAVHMPMKRYIALSEYGGAQVMSMMHPQGHHALKQPPMAMELTRQSMRQPIQNCPAKLGEPCGSYNMCSETQAVGIEGECKLFYYMLQICFN
ncbi:hypothetical protein J1N35_032536 [Gossypium stocksii]|uniref:Uncharacterized protein n=1 Tax=Gossypium stocksii TaxID=47602 RepID=A0A9D3V6D5_9ROSI|nr:hypothetical protein J1N35_032536 [Gossypium stocksii]